MQHGCVTMHIHKVVHIENHTMFYVVVFLCSRTILQLHEKGGEEERESLRSALNAM